MNFKFGVLFAKDGQLTDDEMFSNGEQPLPTPAERDPALYLTPAEGDPALCCFPTAETEYLVGLAFPIPGGGLQSFLRTGFICLLSILLIT